MSRTNPLPHPLSSRSFAVSEAHESGVSASRLRAADLSSVFRGARVHNAVDEDAPETQRVLHHVEAFLPLLKPWQVFSHTTAAVFWGFPLPRSAIQHHNGRIPLHVSVAEPRRPPQRAGIIGHRSRYEFATTTIDEGFRVTDPLSTWFGLAALPASQLPADDLIAAGDYLVRDPEIQSGPWDRPFASFEHVRNQVQLFRGPGKSRAETALRMMREGADSRPETLLRLLLLRAGLPKPELNPVILDRSGARIGRVDMAYPGYKVIVEYDGDQHRTTTAQYEHDMTRVSHMQRDDWIVIRVRQRGLFVEPQRTIAQVRAALHDRGWRPAAGRRANGTRGTGVGR